MGAYWIGRCLCEDMHLYVTPFYKKLSATLRPGLPTPIPTENLNGLLGLDANCLPGLPTNAVEQYWDAWWIPGSPNCTWNWKLALDVFLKQV